MISQIGVVMGYLLTYLHGFLHSYGLSIIVLTVLLRLVLVPLTIPQLRMTRKMSEIGPAVKQLQTKYKGDPQRQQKEMMELWKKHNVNPAAGCLPLLLQMPFLWALYYTFQTYNYTGNASFLWVGSLSHPDPLHIMAVLVAITTFLSMRYASITPATGDPSQRITFLILPLMFGYISVNFAAGLSLYWIASNLFTFVQQTLLLRYLPGLKGGTTHP